MYHSSLDYEKLGVVILVGLWWSSHCRPVFILNMPAIIFPGLITNNKRSVSTVDPIWKRNYMKHGKIGRCSLKNQNKNKRVTNGQVNTHRWYILGMCTFRKLGLEKYAIYIHATYLYTLLCFSVHEKKGAYIDLESICRRFVLLSMDAFFSTVQMCVDK